MPEDNETIYELTDVTVDTLGLVTRGANKEDFFMLKSEVNDSALVEDTDKDATNPNEVQTADQQKMEEITEAVTEAVTKSVWQKIKDLFKRASEQPEEIIETEKVDTGTLEEEFDKAVWDTAYVNNLPDSAFFFIESGGEKDGEGKTKPRSLRHLPYKDASGNIDLPHLRNAIARIPQMNAYPGLNKDALQKKAQKLLEEHNSSKTASDSEKSDGSTIDVSDVADTHNNIDTNAEAPNNVTAEKNNVDVSRSETIGDATMPEETISKAEFEKAQSELADIRKQLADAKSEKDQLVWINKASTFGYAPVASTELATHLYAISKLDEAQANWLVDLLKAYDAMLEDSGMFIEKGKTIEPVDEVEKALKSNDPKAALLGLDRKTAETYLENMRKVARR